MAASVQCLNVFKWIFFSLSASILYTVNSSAQHETPNPLNFIEQLNKNLWSSKKKTKLKCEHKEQFCKPCRVSMLGYLGAYGALLTPLVQATSSWHSVNEEIITGDHLVSCVAGITAAVYVCTDKTALESTPCAQSLICKERNWYLLAPLLRLPEELSEFLICSWLLPRECFVAVNWSEATESALSPLVVCLTNSIDLKPGNCRQIEIVLTNSSSIFISLRASKIKLRK